MSTYEKIKKFAEDMASKFDDYPFEDEGGNPVTPDLDEPDPDGDEYRERERIKREEEDNQPQYGN